MNSRRKNPQRFVNLSKNKERFGDRIHRYADLLWVGDPLGDECANELQPMGAAGRERVLIRALSEGSQSLGSDHPKTRALIESIEHVPTWVDREKIDLGGRVLLRTGIFAPLVLMCKSLPLSYCMPAGNKPLALTGELINGAKKRVIETGQFLLETCLPNGLQAGQPGIKQTVRVRLLHSMVRLRLSQSPKWSYDLWGHPINQADMGAANLLFSSVLLDGLIDLGIEITSPEMEAVMHLWRYSGHLMGVHPDVLVTHYAEAQSLWEMVIATQEPPDQDSRRLTHSILSLAVNENKNPEDLPHAERVTQFAYGLSRYLVGDHYADALGLPRGYWPTTLKVIKPLIAQIEKIRARVPGGDEVAYQMGMRFCRKVVEAGVLSISIKIT